MKKKKKIPKNIFFCENEKLDYPRFLGDFYCNGTMNLPCIREPTSIRNWVTFCGVSIIVLGLKIEMILHKEFDLHISRQGTAVNSLTQPIS